MKPEDLNPPFPKSEYRTAIDDRVWYAPERANDPIPFLFPGWDDPLLFGNANPVIVEYCSGNGAWIADRAEQNPLLNWVAVERKFDRVRKIWSKIKNRQLQNLIVICGEAHAVTARFFPAASVSEVFINFPDPWPKNRHAKNRLIQRVFADELKRVLLPGQPVTFVTDDPPYSDWAIEVLCRQSTFKSSFPDPYYVTESSGYGTSYFEQLWRSKGRAIRYHRFVP